MPAIWTRLVGGTGGATASTTPVGCFINSITRTIPTNGWTTSTIAVTTTAGTEIYWVDSQVYQNQLNEYMQRQIQSQMANAWYTPAGLSRGLMAQQGPTQAELDQAAYEKAVSEHDEQEAARIKRVIDEREAERIRIAEERRIENERRAAERAVEDQRKEAAKIRAEGLLLEHLTPAQQKTYKENGWFVVMGGKSKTKYRIKALNHLVANIDVLDKNDKVKHRLCAHPPSHACPLGDHLLAQKMTLEIDEDHFLKVANVHRA